MYDTASIDLLKARIGFGKDNGISVNVSEDHKTGTSGRLFSRFHKLVTLKNLYMSVEEIDMAEGDFNDYLDQLKTDAVLSALVAILNQNESYQDETDYSGTISTKPEIFDEVVGYSLAIAALEEMVSTNRKNDEERNANLSYQQLKIELDGITDEKGFVRSKGITRKLNAAIIKAQNIIFPYEPKIENANVW